MGVYKMTNQVNTKNTANKLKNQANQKNGAGQKRPAPAPQNKKEKGETIADLITKMEPEIKKAVPEHIKPERLARIALTAVRHTPKLAECDQISFIGAVMQAAQMGLEPNTGLGEAYIIPYGDKATFQIGYKGILSLAHRTGQYKAIYAQEVYKNDKFDFSYGLDKTIYHKPADLPEGDPIYYYAVYKLTNGGYDLVVWSKKRLQQHAKKFSSALNNSRTTSPWQTDFISMAKKTVLKDVLKYAPKSIEFSQQMTSDYTVVNNLEDEPEQVDIIDMDQGQQEQPQENQNGQAWWQ